MGDGEDLGDIPRGLSRTSHGKVEGVVNSLRSIRYDPDPATLIDLAGAGLRSIRMTSEAPNTPSQPESVPVRGAGNAGVVERILLIRPSALGDVCRTVPVLSRLRERFPGARIDWLVQDSFAEAIAEHPALRLRGGGPVLFPRKRFHRWWSPSIAREVLGWLSGLKNSRYDLVIDAQGLFRSGLFAWWTRAQERLGYSTAAEMAWLGYTRRIAAPGADQMHAVDRMMRLASAACGDDDNAAGLGAPDMRLYCAEADRTQVSGWVGGGGRLVVLAPTSRWAGKRWPAERFASVASALLRDQRAGVGTVCFVGSESERAQCAALIELSARQGNGRVVDLLGRTSVGQLMALVERADLIVANDSAVLHMGVGFDRPLVALFGPTYVDLVGPYGRGGDVIQHLRPGDRLDHKDEQSGRGLMERISVEEVFDAARVRLAR